MSTCLQSALNAGALLDKEALLCALGPGIWTASETHHTARAVPIIKGRMRKRGFHMRFSAPVAPYTTGIAQLISLASGTSCFSDLPIRSSSGFVPVEVRGSARFLHPSCRYLLIVLYKSSRCTGHPFHAHIPSPCKHVQATLTPHWTVCPPGPSFAFMHGLMQSCDRRKRCDIHCSQHAGTLQGIPSCW